MGLANDGEREPKTVLTAVLFEARDENLEAEGGVGCEGRAR